MQLQPPGICTIALKSGGSTQFALLFRFLKFQLQPTQPARANANREVMHRNFEHLMKKKCRNDNAPPLPPHGHNGGLGSWIVVDPGLNDEIHGVARTFAKAINKIFLNNDSQNT